MNNNHVRHFINNTYKKTDGDDFAIRVKLLGEEGELIGGFYIISSSGHIVNVPMRGDNFTLVMVFKGHPDFYINPEYIVAISEYQE